MDKKINRLQNLVNQIKNDITIPILCDFLDWFILKLHFYFFKEEKKFVLQKGDIFYVNLGKNIGSELNKNRPCIVSKRKFNAGGTVIIIPLRSYKGRNKKYFIKINLSKENNLGKISQADILAIRQVDKKRLLNRIGYIDKKYLDKIDSILLKILV